MKFAETVSARQPLCNDVVLNVTYHKGNKFLELAFAYPATKEAVVMAPKLKELDEIITALQNARNLLDPPPVPVPVENQ